MADLIEVTKPEHIPPALRNTPVAELLEYHNLDRPFDTYQGPRARLLVGMCMDSRKHLKIPENFAYIIRAGGGNLRYSEFKVSYAIANGVTAIALLAHNNCGMVHLADRRELFIQGLIDNAGWDREAAAQHFEAFAPMFEIGNEIDFVKTEARRLNARYPKVLVAPMLYNVDDNRLYLVPE